MKPVSFLVAFIGCGLVAPASLANTPGEGWERIGTEEGITVFRKEMPGTSLVAFRGEGSITASIGKLITVVTTPEKFPEWTDMLVDVAPVEHRELFDLTVWEHYDNPWPISDRDFVYRGVGEPNESDRTFTIRFKSVERKDVPEQGCCIRGKIMNTMLRFTARQDGTTFVECEVFLDPKGWLPAWLVNIVQKDWPINTIKGLEHQASKPDMPEYKAFAHWHLPAHG